MIRHLLSVPVRSTFEFSFTPSLALTRAKLIWEKCSNRDKHWRVYVIRSAKLSRRFSVHLMSKCSLDRPTDNQLIRARIRKLFDTFFHVFFFHFPLSLCTFQLLCVIFFLAVDNRQRQWFGDSHLAWDSQKFNCFTWNWWKMNEIMLNDAKYKSCLTLILASPDSSIDNSVECGVNDDPALNEMISENRAMNSSVEMNLNQLPHKMNRTFVHSDSFNRSLDSNETIIPIKYLSKDESIDSDQMQSADTDTATVSDTSPKYCCTLEVKFVWYEEWKLLKRWHLFFHEFFFFFSFWHFFSSKINWISFLFLCARYELSQDLLDKQIELLERKYGGIRARHAAITIQKAFRHYTMVKRFASITAMAKAEKRLSRRLPLSTQQSQTQPQQPQQQQQQQQMHSSPLT